MPYYSFVNTKTGEYRDIFFHMNDEKVYNGEPGENGKGLWQREYSVPRASIDTEVDPYSSKDFVKATNKSNGTMGDMWDRSAELSQKRADKEGKDPLKQQYFDNYRKTHRGKPHYLEQREINKETFKKAGISIEYND